MDSLPLDVTTRAPISRQLADFALALRVEDIPADVMGQAKRHVLDSLGIALAASGYDYAARTAAAISGLAGIGSHPVIGMVLRLPLRDAVMLNGALLHGLDYDDTHSDADVEAKFLDNAQRRVSPDRARRILDLVMGLDAAPDVLALTEALNG